MTKVSLLPTETASTDDDFILMVDNASGLTKKVTVATLMQRPGTAAFTQRINNGTTTRSIATATLADIPGTPVITVTAGTRAIKIHVHLIIMGSSISGGGQQCFINVNGTNQPAGCYFSTTSTTWDVQHIYEIIDVAAGATATIKAQWVGAGLNICNANNDAAYPEFINGWIQTV